MRGRCRMIIVEQIRSALERLSSNQALQEVRGAIREYRDSEKRQTLAGRRRANSDRKHG